MKPARFSTRLQGLGALVLAASLGCNEATVPTAPSTPRSSRILLITDDEAAILADAGIVVRQPAAGEQAATGGVWYGTPPSMLAFSAVLHRDGKASGEYEYRSADGLIRAHGSVTCLMVSGNSARFSGDVTEGALAGELQFSVRDNGEGTNDPPDLVAGPVPGSACGLAAEERKPEPVVRGNLQVHQ